MVLPFPSITVDMPNRRSTAMEHSEIQEYKMHPGTDFCIIKFETFQSITLGDLFVGHLPWACVLKHFLFDHMAETYQTFPSGYGWTYHYLGAMSGRGSIQKEILRIRIPRGGARNNNKNNNNNNDLPRNIRQSWEEVDPGWSSSAQRWVSHGGMCLSQQHYGSYGELPRKHPKLCPVVSKLSNVVGPSGSAHSTTNQG
jgi:hypothetical protein